MKDRLRKSENSDENDDDELADQKTVKVAVVAYMRKIIVNENDSADREKFSIAFAAATPISSVSSPMR